MDPISSDTTLNVSLSEMPLAKTSSSTSNTASAEVVQKPNVLAKRVVRKITPLDPKKLQQAGLDRKIAEALSKQKSQLNNKSPLNRIPNVQTPTSSKVSSTEPISFTVSKSASSSINAQEVTPAKKPIITKKVTPPKITITGPEAQTVLNTQNLEDLNPHERLVHVKNLLNKKLLQKKKTEINDKHNDKPSVQHLQPPSTSSFVSSKNNLTARSPPSPPSSSYNCSQYKLPLKNQKEVKAKPNLYCDLKKPAEVVMATQIETPQKSPQDIARKLQFPTDAERKVTEESGNENIFKCLNENFKEIPKASIKANKSQQQQQQHHHKNVKQKLPQQKGEELLPAKEIHATVNVSQNPKSFQNEYLKQQKIKCSSNEIPKAKIKTGQQYSLQEQKPYGYKPLKQGEQKLDFPEVSPLKAPFPMVNVPKETPLPAIDSFKKPFNTGNTTGCYDFQQNFISETSTVWPNYVINQQPTSAASTLAKSNLNFDTNAAVAAGTTLTNSLIVLENKVLTQDEMIDLTELRLSTATPRFINPHKPIPEVVIKEENTDEYPAADLSTSVNSAEKISQAEVAKEMSTAKVVIANKQNKKIIINAQKLKLPPEQLADLARKIKQKTSNAKNAATKNLNESNKVTNITVFITKDAAATTAATATTTTATTTTATTTSTTSSRKTPTNLANFVVPPHNPDVTAQYPKESPVKLFIQNNQIYVHVNKPDESKICDTICDNNETPKNNLPQNSQTTKDFLTTESCINLKDQINKSAVEIIDEPVDTENCFSAVDFIAALSNTNDINEETSLELSPEELNLSASCNMNPLPLNIQANTSNKKIETVKPCQITSTMSLKSNINDNLLNNQQVGTIVIESSNGPQTILTKDSPHKFDNGDNNDKVKVLNEMEIEKSLKNILNPDCSVIKRPDLKVANSSHTDCQDTKTLSVASTEKFCDPKLFDNMEVKDMEIEDMTALVTTKADAKMVDDLKIISGKKSTNTNTTTSMNIKNDKEQTKDTNQVDLKAPNVQSNENMENILKPKTKTTLEDLAKPNTTKNTTTSPIKSGENSYLKAETNKLGEENKFENSNISVKHNNQTDSYNISNNFQKVLKTTADPKDLSPNDTTSTPSLKSSGAEKVDQKSESVTAKRISRFKKGKINLVQRNKMGQGSNQALPNNDKVSTENKANTEENRNELNENLNKESNKESNKKSLIEMEPENVKATHQSRKISGQNDDNIKATATITTKSLNEIQDLQKTDQTLSISKITEPLPTDETKIMPLENETFPKNIEPIAKEKFSSKTLESDVSKASIKIDKHSEQDLNSTKTHLTKSVNRDHLNIQKGSVEFGSISQQLSNTVETSLNKSLDIDTKDMTKLTTADTNSQQHSKSQELSLTKSLDSDIISISKASVRISQIPQQDSNIPEKNLTESLAGNTLDVPGALANKGNDTLQPINTEIGIVPKETVGISNSLQSYFKTAEKASIRRTSISQQFLKAPVEMDNINEQLLNSPSLQQHSKSTEQSVMKVSKSEVIETPKSSTTTGNDLPQHLNYVEGHLITNSLQVTEASVKMDNSLQGHSSSPNRGRESLNTVILEVPKAAVNLLERSLSQSVNSIDIPEASSKVDSAQQHSNIPSTSLTNSYNTDNMAPTKTTDSIPQQLSSSTNIRTQQNNHNEQKKSSEMAVTYVTVEQGDVQERMSEISSRETQAQKTPQTFPECKELPDHISITESSKNIAAQKDQDKILNHLAQQPQEENFEQDCGIKILNKQEIKAEAKTETENISKSDLSPIKSQESNQGTASKKVCNDTNVASKEQSTPKKLLKQLESNNKEKDKLEYQPEQSRLPVENEVRKSLEKGDEQTVLGRKRSSRTGSKGRKSQTETTATAGSSGTRHSIRPLISDDELKLLPENAKINLKLAKSKQNETMQPTTPLTTATTTTTTTTHKRQQRLYSKPIELELTSPSSRPCKRTRYYSQSMETNVTLTFDVNPFENVKPVERIESCQDKTQETNATTTKQIKTIDVQYESQEANDNNPDSEDENYDYDCSMKDCEESNEFLGFEEISESNSFKKVSNDAKEIEGETKTKYGGTLKNWLTTGKAISPTFDKVKNTKRLPNQDELTASTTTPSSSSAIGDTLKKRWDLYSNLNEDTDITDDTSPLDDEEEIREQIPMKKSFKRGTTNVIDSNKNLLEDKKIKLDDSFEHSFIRPNTSSSDTGCHEKKVRKSLKSQLKRKSSEESLFETKVEEVSLSFKDKKEQEIKCGKTGDNSQAVDKSDCQQQQASSSLRYQGNPGKCDTVSNSPNARESKRLKSKDKTKNAKVTSKRTKKHSKNTDTDTDSSCHDRMESEKLNTVPILGAEGTTKMEEEHQIHDKGSTSKDSDRERRKAPKLLEAEDVKDNSDIEGSNRQKSSPTSFKQKADIPKQQTIEASENFNNENFANQEESENLKTPKTVINENENSTIQTEKAEAESCCTTPKNSTIKRKRGRPKRNPIQTLLTPSDPINEIETQQKDLKTTNTSEPSDNESPLPSAKKRRLQTSSLKSNKTEDSDSEFKSLASNKTQEMTRVDENLELIATPTLGLVKQETPAVVRKRKSCNEPNFNPRLLLITKREQLDTDEVITETEPGTGAIQCGLCLERTQPTKWKSHLAKHYGVGWKVGKEQLNVENRSVVLSTILNYMKGTNNKGLCCRMCQKVYRSALGLLMHIESCGAQAIRLQCEFCNRDFAKSSLLIHMRTCSAKPAAEDSSSDENVDEKDTEKKEEIFGNSGRLKRHSTIKAENKLKKLGEELEKISDSVTTEKAKFDPKTRIRYVPPLEDDFTAKWSEDIEKLGQASCPKTRCKFTSTDVKELNDHLKNCKHIKSGYFCNFCLQRRFATEKEAIAHVLKEHQHGRGRKKSDNDSDVSLKTDTEESSDDNDLSEGENESEIENENENATDQEDDLDDNCDNKKGNKKKKSKKPCNRNLNKSTNQTNHRKQVFEARCTDVNKKVLTKWKNFLKLNHSCEPLYTEFKTQYSVINNRDYDKYLPTQTVSMKFHLTTKPTLNRTIGEHKENIEWSELKRFESMQNEKNTYFFLGAPVKLCSWLPLPAHVNEQYLAVVYRQDMFKFIKFSQPKQRHTIILIFKVIINNKTPELNVHYGFLINDGPIHYLSFLPSGGYDETSNRLGLMAIATVTSTIKVCSLPLNVDLESPRDNPSGDQTVTLIEVKPSFLLNLDILNNKEEKQQHVLLNPQCMQICWSEYLGHQHIFAGFSNGFLGIWDITNDPHQNLNRFEVEGVLNYVPLNYFYVGEKCVKCFAVHYDTCGPRWLAVSTAYRKLIIYDIKNFSQPIIMKEDINKNIMTSMDWCPLWETVLCSFCDPIPNNGRCVLVINPVNIMFSHVKLDLMACGVAHIHYTPVTNMCVAAMNNGDIAILDTKELHYEFALPKPYCGRRMLYSLDVKQLNGQPIVKLPKANQKTDTDTTSHKDWVMHDIDYKEKYGLIFQPLIRLKESDRNIYLSENRCPPLNMMPLMRINTLRCNLNFNSKNLIALGYENGFLRLVYFDKAKHFCN